MLEPNIPGSRIERPILRYHGGKFRLAPELLKIFPPHRVYTEAFGGGASVLLLKPRCYSEIYNDLDGEVVNVFRVLQNPRRAKRLELLLRRTPFARQEFLLSYKHTRSEVERARRTLIRAFTNTIGKTSIEWTDASWKPRRGRPRSPVKGSVGEQRAALGKTTIEWTDASWNPIVGCLLFR